MKAVFAIGLVTLVTLVTLVACAPAPKPDSFREIEIGRPLPSTIVDAAPPVVKLEPTAEQRAAADAIARGFDVLVGDSILPGEPKALREAAFAAIGFVGSKDAKLHDAVIAMAELGKLPADAVLRAAHAMTDAADDPSTFAMSPATKQGLFSIVSGTPVVQPGIVLNRRDDGRWAIGHVVAGSGAAAAGAQRGDVVIALDKFPIKRGFVDLVPMFGAPSGTKIVLTIERGGVAQDLAITLGGIAPAILEQKLVGTVGVVRLWSCTQSDNPARDAGRLLAGALRELDRKRATALVLDLRGNAGGYPFDIASLLVDADPLLVALGQDSARQPVPRTIAAWKTKRPIVVIVDEQTSTGAEMIAFILREHAGARIVGRPTAGALAFPSTETIGAGISVTYPISRAASPRTAEAGVVPDNRITPDVAVANPTPEQYAAHQDPQLDAAVAEATAKR